MKNWSELKGSSLTKGSLFVEESVARQAVAWLAMLGIEASVQKSDVTLLESFKDFKATREAQSIEKWSNDEYGFNTESVSSRMHRLLHETLYRDEDNFMQQRHDPQRGLPFTAGWEIKFDDRAGGRVEKGEWTDNYASFRVRFTTKVAAQQSAEWVSSQGLPKPSVDGLQAFVSLKEFQSSEVGGTAQKAGDVTALLAKQRAAGLEDVAWLRKAAKASTEPLSAMHSLAADALEKALNTPDLPGRSPFVYGDKYRGEWQKAIWNKFDEKQFKSVGYWGWRKTLPDRIEKNVDPSTEFRILK